MINREEKSALNDKLFVMFLFIFLFGIPIVDWLLDGLLIGW